MGTLTARELRAWLDRINPGTYVVIQVGPDGSGLVDVRSVTVAHDAGQTEEDVLVLIPEAL